MKLVSLYGAPGSCFTIDFPNPLAHQTLMSALAARRAAASAKATFNPSTSIRAASPSRHLVEKQKPVEFPSGHSSSSESEQLDTSPGPSGKRRKVESSPPRKPRHFSQGQDGPELISGRVATGKRERRFSPSLPADEGDGADSSWDGDVTDDGLEDGKKAEEAVNEGRTLWSESAIPVEGIIAGPSRRSDGSVPASGLASMLIYDQHRRPYWTYYVSLRARTWHKYPACLRKRATSCRFR